MFNEKFNEVLTKEGVVSITSWSEENVHVVNTWNSYLVKSGENKLLIPAAGMRKQILPPLAPDTATSPRVSAAYAPNPSNAARTAGLERSDSFNTCPIDDDGE